MDLLLQTRKAPVWLRNAVLIAMASLAVYLVLAWAWPWQPGRIGGLVFGILAALLFVNAGAYPWRRRWGARPLGTARRWLQLHVYGSTLALLFVLIHIGFRSPSGIMGWLLLLLSAWTTASGLLGVWLQRLVPVLLSRRLTVEAIYERIPDLVLGLAKEADALMAGASDVFARAYASEIRPVLAAPRVNVAWITGSSRTREDTLGPLVRIRPFLNESDRARLEDLESIVHDKVDLDAQLSLQRVLRTWLVIHVPPAILLLGVLAVHVTAVVWL